MRSRLFNVVVFLSGLLIAGQAVARQGAKRTFSELGHFRLTERTIFQRTISDLESFRLGSFNALQFGRNELSHRGTVEWHYNKSHRQLLEIREMIVQQGLDLLVMQEVQDLSVLQRFSAHYLDGKYAAVVTKSNDSSNQIGFLIRNDLPFHVTVQSFAGERYISDASSNTQRAVFTRDIPTLVFTMPGRKKASFAVIGVHYKASHGARDRKSWYRRIQELKYTARAIAALRKEHGDRLPIFLAGDFNGNVHRDFEFRKLLSRSGLVNVFGRTRTTHTWHGSGNAVRNQLDHILTSRTAVPYLRKSWVYRYRDLTTSRVRPFPESFKEQGENPSDHFPVVSELNLTALLTSLNRK